MNEKDPYVLKNELLAARYDEFVKNGFANYLKVNDEFVENYRIYEAENAHIFFGYYDLPQISEDGTKMLVLKVEKNASTESDLAEIYYIDLENDSWHFITNTKSWCWQQGCRLRWVPNSNTRIIFNNAVAGRYISEMWDVERKIKILEYPYAFYDIAMKTSFGLGLDFSRLQRMRPGYGYSSLPESTEDYIATEKGIYIYNFIKKEYKNIISLKSLASEVPAEKNEIHYINHICISPNEDKFIFFHLWARDGISMWNMRLMVSDEYGNYKTLEDNEIISHYCWINNDEILVTRILKEEGNSFVIYNVNTGEKKIIENKNLVQDGHPVMLQDRNHFVVDTYPLENCIQKMFIASISDCNKYGELVSAFSDPRLYIEHRCDMHPRVHMNSNQICFDTTFSDGVRKCVVLKLNSNFKIECGGGSL